MNLSSLLCLVALSVLCAPTAPATAYAEDDKEKVSKALEMPLETTFKRTPLQDVVDFLAAKYAIKISLATGAGPRIPIVYEAKRPPEKPETLRAALSAILRPHGLGFEVKDGTLVIAPVMPKKK